MQYLLSTIADIDYSQDAAHPVVFQRAATIAKAWGLGLELAEFCVTENIEDRFDETLPRFENNCQSSQLKVMHGPFFELYPHAIDPKVAQIAWERYDWSWNLCKKYQIDKLVCHPNFVKEIYYPEWFISRQVDFWQRFLLRHSEGITICLENVLEPDPSLIIDILQGVGDQRLRMCLDTGHANLTKIPPVEWLERCAPYISHYHIHNNDGPLTDAVSSQGDLHQPPGRGSIDMKDFLRRATELTPNATATIESVHLEESARWLHENGFIRPAPEHVLP